MKFLIALVMTAIGFFVWIFPKHRGPWTLAEIMIWVMIGLIVTLVIYLVIDLFFGVGGLFGPKPPPPTPGQVARAKAALKIWKGGQEVAEGLAELQRLNAEEAAERGETHPEPQSGGSNWLWWLIAAAIAFWFFFFR